MLYNATGGSEMDEKGAELFEAVKHYTEAGIITHLIRPPEVGKTGTGKNPFWYRWNARQEPYPIKYMQQEIERHPSYNVGILCGKASDITVLDIDWQVKGISDYLFKELDYTEWVRQVHGDKTTGKGHLFFRYAPKLVTGFHQDLGFDILTQKGKVGANCVCAPSVHMDGTKYRMSHDISKRVDMPPVLIKRINCLVNTYTQFKIILSKCKRVFRPFWEDVFTHKHSEIYHRTGLFTGAEGRRRHLALFNDLRANGATNEMLLIACMMIFGNDYDCAKSIKEIKYIDRNKPWRLETILQDPVLASYYVESNFNPEKANLNELEKLLNNNVREVYQNILGTAPIESVAEVKRAFLIGHFSR